VGTLQLMAFTTTPLGEVVLPTEETLKGHIAVG
jgi:hypothetical protein